MSNPFFERRQNIYIYVLVWFLISGIHFLTGTIYFDLPFIVAAADSLIYNGLFALIAVILWYPVRYNNPEGKFSLSSLITYLFLGIIIITFWLFMGYFILKILFTRNEEYFRFLNDSFYVRVLFGILFFIATVLLYHLLVYYKALEGKRLNEAQLNLLVRESELNALRSQLNPHFLFNSLNSISSLTVSNPDKAREMIIQLSDFLRYALKYGQREETTFADELKNIELYLNIEKTRFEDKLVFEKNINGVCMQAKVPNMILQPLVENAIKHGVYESTTPVVITLSCQGIGDYLEIRLKNNFDPEYKSRTGAGLGLRNVENRLQLIYNTPDLLKVNKQDNNFEVIINIPQKRH
jgi:two-component system, LytTR family, sensor kinase